ncbi:hypothetical protein H5410_050343 [Solanum commersonii]|uniref:NB-ARC domain containing protein n=1 Tax=Solanum commersonii TaxID=4109 RepID=A0A9J5WXB5_SOLCO|nr:hypothetical protein H5410_050343 [Solanum commersonii]
MEERQGFMIEEGLHQAMVFKLSHGAPDLKLVAIPFEQNRAHSMDVVTSNIDAQTTTKNKGGTPRVGVDVPRVGSGKKIMDSGHKLLDTSDVDDAENFGQHVFEKGVTGNFYDSGKRQYISNVSRDLLCSNSFDALWKSTEKQVKLTENDNDLIQEKQVSPSILNSKLSLEALVFVPKCVIAKKNESRVLVSNTIDLGEDFLDENEEVNMLDFGEDSLDEDEEDIMDIDISPRQQISGSNRSKKKTHGRQHSWDGKMTEEFVPRHLPMRQAKQNNLTVSIGSTRSNN